MKILDYALLTLLSGAAPVAGSQPTLTTPNADAAAAAAAAADVGDAAPSRCTQDQCRTEDGSLLFQVKSRGARDALAAGKDAATLQTDRRATVERYPQAAAPTAAPGRATATGKFSVQLPNGGIIWATEDPTLTAPELSISAPAELAFENGRLTKPVQFYLRTNYPAFVQRFEVKVYRASDTALVEPLTTLSLPVAAVSRIEWQDELKAKYPLRAGDELVYVLRAYGLGGEVDETQPRRLKLVRPEDAERTSTLLRESIERSQGTAFTALQAQRQSLIQQVFSGNDLRQQNIPIYGSRIRIQGRNLPQDSTLLINGEDYPTDLERKFVAEFLSPVGQHAFDIVVKTRDQLLLRHTLNVEVTGKYLFAVALADLTLYQNNATGAGREMALAGREDDVLADGRLAFYGKAKVDGKYLITAHADTQERDVKNLFSGFFKADPQDFFRRFDPDQYYPSYGDDSTTVRDVDTQGRLYFRVDWDKNQALWGSFMTDLTGTEHAQYVRGLYGAGLQWRSKGANLWGDPRTRLRAFASEAQTAPGHSEFIGTAGSLYYLRHTDILPGSETVVVEVRNPTTGRVEERRTLQRGVDYDLNDLQGRILLVRPLLQQVGQTGVTASITRDTPGAGLEQRLIVDYEWMPLDHDSQNLIAGLRAKHWVGDHVGVGGTYVNERRSGEDYELKGADVTLQAGRGTWLRAEHSQSQSTGAPVFFSTNGGLSFTQLNASTASRSGEATSVEGQVNLQELGLTDRSWSAGAWRSEVDAGYSVAREDIGVDRKTTGAEVRGQLSNTAEVLAQQSRSVRGEEQLDQSQVTAQWRINDDHTLTGEMRRITEIRATEDPINGTLGAVKYNLRLTTNLDVYGIAQVTLDDDEGRYADNDALTLGMSYTMENLSVVGAEVTHGDRGNAVQVNAEYKLSTDHTIYGNVSHTTDTSEYDALFNSRLRTGWTLGQRWRASERTNFFNESQYIKERESNGLLHTFGLDFYPSTGWSTGVTVQSGELEATTGTVNRRAVSVSASRTSPDTDWSSKLEWREDTGAEQRRQWVTANHLTHKINEDWRISARFKYADTRDFLNVTAGARFVESGLGFAWRPHDNNRYVLLGRYTYLYDLSSLGQLSNIDYDQKSHIVSTEGVYKYDGQWSFATKLAHREGRARAGRGTGSWFNSSATFSALQARYSLRQQWYGLGELRSLKVKQGGLRTGFLVGVDRDITKNLRIGIGYNFTDFSDDLTRFDYQYQGWYINMVGSY